MSVLFGYWNFEGQQPPSDYMDGVGDVLAPYGPDSNEAYCKGGIWVLYRAFHTTKESHHEIQPHVSRSGMVITWDGVVDNRAELLAELEGFGATLTDVEIVAAAFDLWGIAAFSKIIGDWALSIWNPEECTLTLAKDFLGTRHLYYTVDHDRVTWSTTLEPLVRCSDKALSVCEEYIAGWLSMFPASHLSPYVGIHSVPPASFVQLGPGKHTVKPYWNFDARKQIRYRVNADYEEHFRDVLSKAVLRKIRSDRPVLAELSGGRDSSAIVCIADAVINQNRSECPRLDTISYYDDTEPTWNERPFFTKVEEKRGRQGWHIDLGAESSKCLELDLGSAYDRFVATPGDHPHSLDQLKSFLISQGNRVLLSGIGGDEFMGGVPTPLPELQDLLVNARFRLLTRQLKLWALQMRKPWVRVFLEMLAGFLPVSLVGIPKQLRPAPWLQSKFVNRHREAVSGYPARIKLLYPLPSFQGNLGTLEVLRRQLAHAALPSAPPFVKRYPLLDRDLLEFIFAIPREQLVTPTCRRFLMRRALAGIVPEEILKRKGKAFVARAPFISISNRWQELIEFTRHMVSSVAGIVDAEAFVTTLKKARCGEQVPMIAVMRTISLEHWLRSISTVSNVNLPWTQTPQRRAWFHSMTSDAEKSIRIAQYCGELLHARMRA